MESWLVPLRNKQKYKYTNNMQVMLMRLMSKGEYLIVPKGTKFTGAGKLGLRAAHTHIPFSGEYPPGGPTHHIYININ